MVRMLCSISRRSYWACVGAFFLSFSIFVGSAGVHAEDKVAEDRVKVVTTFTVIADIARNVAGDAAIVKAGTTPCHHLMHR